MENGIYEAIEGFKKFHNKHNRLALIFFSIITGIITGIVVSLYTQTLNNFSEIRNFLINYFNGYNFIFIILLFIIISFIIHYSVKKYPLASGSGIPQVMALIQKKIKFNWLPELIVKFFSGALAIFNGLSLGREGPSIHLGVLLGEGVNEITKRSEIDKKYLITCGASAGISAAFNAPLAGTIFAIEELHKFFSPILLICVLISSLFSNLVSKLILGDKLSFEHFSFISPIKYDLNTIILHLILISILSFISVIFAFLFNYFIVKFKVIYDKVKLSGYTKMSIVSMISLIIVIYIPEISGGGHPLVESLFGENYLLRFLIILLIGKFFFTMLSYSTGAPGGIFLPLLVIGALLGKLYGIFLVNVFNFPTEHITLFVLIAMASYFTAVVKAPITGIVLILEMSGNFSNLFSLAIASAITYALSELFKQESVYEILLEKMIGHNEDKDVYISENISTLKIPIVADSILSGKKIKDIKWPDNLLVVGVERKGKQFIPDGETTLQNSDIIIIFSDENTIKKYSSEILEASIKVTLK